MTAEKSLKVGKTQNTVAVAGRGGFGMGSSTKGFGCRGKRGNTGSKR